jgi:hypothetical protein
LSTSEREESVIGKCECEFGAPTPPVGYARTWVSEPLLERVNQTTAFPDGRFVWVYTAGVTARGLADAALATAGAAARTDATSTQMRPIIPPRAIGQG